MTGDIDTIGSPWDSPANNTTPRLPSKRAAITGGELLGAPILWLAKAILFAACLSIFWHTMADLNNSIFPNKSGLNDLDRMEIFFYGAWLFLTWRCLAKVLQHQAALHRAVYRYVTAFGIHAMFFASTELLLAPYISTTVIASDNFYDLVAITSELTWLLLLFAIVPKGVLVIPEAEKKSEELPSNRNENRN